MKYDYGREYYNRKQREYKARHPEYRKKWNKTGVMKQIKERLGNSCFICNDSRSIQIHHRYSKRWKGEKRKMDYGITRLNEYWLLCPTHHKALHKNELTKSEKKELEKYNIVIIF